MLFIKNAKLVLETGILWDGAILVDGARIAACGSARELSAPPDAEILDARGLYVGPGFVDIHVHGGNGCFFFENPEAAAAHFLSHGETTILPTLFYDMSCSDFIDSIRRIKGAMGSGAARAISGFYMEGPYMNPKYGSRADKNQWRGEIRTENFRGIVDEAGSLVKVWAIAPERPGIETFLNYARSVHPGVVFSVGHSEATPDQVHWLKKYGLTLQTHCMDATGRVSDWRGTRGAGPDEACMLDDDMYAEIICDSWGVHVNPALIRMVLKTKGLDRALLVTDSFVGTPWRPEGIPHPDDIIIDHNGDLGGSTLTLDIACRNLMSHTNCGIAQAFLLASRNPARVIGMDDEIGTIEPGKLANLVFVDDTFQVDTVLFRGEIQAR